MDNIEEIACKLCNFEVECVGQRLVIITQGDKPVIVAKSKILIFIIW